MPRTCESHVLDRVQVVRNELVASWAPYAAPEPSSPARGAQLESPGARGHEVYEAQKLFSVYVHMPPTAPRYPPSSLFFRREIVPRIEARRYYHSLTVVGLLLLEAALRDTIVQNARFVLLSDACVPSLHAGVVYLQLMSERRSRVVISQHYPDAKHWSNVRFARLLSCDVSVLVFAQSCSLALPHRAAESGAASGPLACLRPLERHGSSVDRQRAGNTVGVRAMREACH